MHTTISRRQRAGWQWPWQRSREDTSCLRLLQALPLRMLQRPGSEAPLLELLAGLADCLRARQALLLLPEAGQASGGGLARGTAWAIARCMPATRGCRQPTVWCCAWIACARASTG
ncbi:hypothetical protein P4200_22785 [Pseudomonas aeruginosa]|nr:hypothetical protein [Pseudomonas aeruginosa]